MTTLSVAQRGGNCWEISLNYKNEGAETLPRPFPQQL